MTKHEKVRHVAESALEPGETLKQFTYVTPSQGLLFVVVLLGVLVGSAFVAGVLTMLFFGRVGPVATLLWIAVAGLAGPRLMAPLTKPTVLALTDRRLLLIDARTGQFGFDPEPVGIEAAYPAAGPLPTGTVSRFGLKHTLRLESGGQRRSFLVMPWPENVEGARRLAADLQTGSA